MIATGPAGMRAGEDARIGSAPGFLVTTFAHYAPTTGTVDCGSMATWAAVAAIPPRR